MKEEYNFKGTPLSYTDGGLCDPYNPLHRPEISYKKFFLALTVFAGLFLVLFFGGRILFSGTAHPGLYRTLFLVLPLLLYLYLISKKAVIWMVHFYQKHASDERRLACVFEPSCSEYMILAVQKYGTIRGVYKGCRRLMRCHPPNHGIDYP